MNTKLNEKFKPTVNAFGIWVMCCLMPYTIPLIMLTVRAYPVFLLGKNDFFPRKKKISSTHCLQIQCGAVFVSVFKTKCGASSVTFPQPCLSISETKLLIQLLLSLLG
jgi:hypothetical protein